MTTEQTSKRVAKIAGRMLAFEPSWINLIVIDKHNKVHNFFWSELKAVAASCLTQTQNKSKRMSNAKSVRAKNARTAKPKEDWRLRRGGKKPRTTKGGVAE